LRRLRRVGCIFAAVAVTASLIDGCGIGGNGPSENSPCNFGGLVLVPVVCVRAEPTQNPDGTWSYSTDNPKASLLHPGTILVVARKSVRRVETVQQANGKVIFTTAAVPLTEVIKDGTIPLSASITPGSVVSVHQVLAPAPPPEPEQPTVSPPSSPSSVPSSVLAMVTGASVSTIRDSYKGDCSVATPDQEPTFTATISVSGGPVTVNYHWVLTDSQGSSTSVPRTLTFSGTGPQTLTDDYSIPVGQYPPGVRATGDISLQVDSPATASGAAVPQQFRYLVDCSAVDVGPSGDSGSGPPNAAPAGDPQARLLAQTGIVVDGYQLQPPPSLTLGSNTFGVDVTASRQVGPALLTWKVHGELDDFLSGGAISIANHQLQNSGMNATGLRGQLRFDWTLSAAVPASIRDNLSLDLPIRLFVEPMPVGDFPVFLGLDINLHAGPEFTSGRALHGYASISFGGGQGLGIHGRALDTTTGLSFRGLSLDSGIRSLVGTPSWNAWVEFPYLSLGDDFYSAGAWLWASPRMEIKVVPGHDPGLCLLAATDGSASAGLEFQLFGLRDTVSTQLFHRPVFPGVSFPSSPACVGS
jgi:hypothetical protein